MTAFTSDVKEHDGISYRVTGNYTVTETAKTVTVSVTGVQLQYKGTYSPGIFERGKIRTAIVNDEPVYNPPEEVQSAYGTYYNINATNFPAKTAWTNKGSTLSNTIVLNKTESARTVDVWIGVSGGSQTSGGVLGASSTTKVASISVPALQSWPVLYKSNNGTSDTFWEQTKYYDKNLPLYPHFNGVPKPENLPTRTGYIKRQTSYPDYPLNPPYVFNTSADGSGQEYTAAMDSAFIGGGGDTYTQNSALTLYMMWSSYVNYDGNGASISVKRQVKDEGSDLVLNSTIPTRSGYVFKEWNTKSDGTGTSYAPGDTYSQDVGEITLYAIWLTMPTKPQIGNMTAIRSNAQGQQDDTGTYASISADWSVDTTSEAYPQNTGTVTGTITPQSTGVEQSFTFNSGASGASGTALALISNLSTDEQYLVKVTVTDQVTSTSKTVILTRAFFIMDFKAGGKGVGIGRAAPNEGLEIGYDATFDDDVTMLEDLEVYGEIHSRSDVTDGNNNTLSLKSNINSPTFTGEPKAPTPAASDDSTKLATTAFVKTAISSKQDTLVSGTNIKTLNSESILGSGDISITGNSMINGLGTASANCTDNTVIITSDASGDTGSWYRRPITSLWNYVLSKIKSSIFSYDSGSADNITIEGSDNLVDKTISLAKTGKTPIAIRGYNITNASSSGGGCSFANVYNFYFSGTTAHLSIHNLRSSSIKIKITVYATYIPS